MSTTYKEKQATPYALHRFLLSTLFTWSVLSDICKPNIVYILILPTRYGLISCLKQYLMQHPNLNMLKLCEAPNCSTRFRVRDNNFFSPVNNDFTTPNFKSQRFGKVTDFKMSHIKHLCRKDNFKNSYAGNYNFF